jgi:transcriptional regulator NrdR family protein
MSGVRTSHLYGLRCPKCCSDDTGVMETREAIDFTLRRRRVCRDCGHRFSTTEHISESKERKGK